jgi:signal transduction histidine kinase
VVGNALQHGAGTVTVQVRLLGEPPVVSRIELAIVRAGGWVEVHVTDEGPGMPADQRVRAFDRFWRGSATDRDGTGLGLAIARQLLEASGGTIELRSGPTAGWTPSPAADPSTTTPRPARGVIADVSRNTPPTERLSALEVGGRIVRRHELSDHARAEIAPLLPPGRPPRRHASSTTGRTGRRDTAGLEP